MVVKALVSATDERQRDLAYYDRLSRGTHEFTVRVTDEAGNTGEDEFTWTVNNPSAATQHQDNNCLK